MSNDSIKKTFLFSMVKLLPCTILITAIGFGIHNVVDYFRVTGDFHGFHSLLNRHQFRYFILPSIIHLIFPILAMSIGLSTRSKISWVAITSYFYYLACNLVFTCIEDPLPDYIATLIVTPIVAFLLVAILLLNHKMISYSHYKIDPSIRLEFNTIPFTLGFLIHILIILYRN